MRWFKIRKKKNKLALENLESRISRIELELQQVRQMYCGLAKRIGVIFGENNNE